MHPCKRLLLVHKTQESKKMLNKFIICSTGFIVSQTSSYMHVNHYFNSFHFPKYSHAWSILGLHLLCNYKGRSEIKKWVHFQKQIGEQQPTSTQSQTEKPGTLTGLHGKQTCAETYKMEKASCKLEETYICGWTRHPGENRGVIDGLRDIHDNDNGDILNFFVKSSPPLMRLKPKQSNKV